jgi:tRNA (uracil-5-)-methyltransferase
VSLKKNQGRPFRAVRAVPVDLFPHTPHCESVVLFERYDEEAAAAAAAADDAGEADGDDGDDSDDAAKDPK